MILALIALQAKHFLCDYPLQGEYMLGKFKAYPDYVKPLAAHSAVHALGTLILCLVFNIPLWCVVLDFVSHFIIDRVKAAPNLGGKYKPHQKDFWWNLGLDQLAHQFVMIFIWSQICQ